MKKVYVALLACLAIHSGFVFAAGNASGAGPASIRLISYAGYHNAMAAAIKGFEDTHPGITVELEDFPFEQLFDAIEIKMGSKDSNYDVVLTDAPMITGYAYHGFITPLDQYFTKDDLKKFTSPLVDSSMYDGKFYSAVLKNSSNVLFYNKKLLDKAKIPYPSSDPAKRMTWEKLVEISQKVMAASGDSSVYGLTFEQISRPYQILPLVNGLGGKGIGPDGVTVDGYVNGPAFVKAMQWYSDIHNKYKIAPKGVSAAETAGQFAAGKICFIATNIFAYKNFSNTPGLEYGYAPLPYFKDGKPVTPTDSWHLSISNFSKKKELAAEFIKYMTIGDGNKIFLGVQGDFAARIDILTSYEADTQYEKAPKSVFKLAAYEAMHTAVPRPLSLGYREWEAIITSTMEDIRNGAAVKPALDKAVKAIDSQMQIYK